MGLSTSEINTLVASYKAELTEKLVTPLTEDKEEYTSRDTAYTELLSYVKTLKETLKSFTATGTDSIFSYKTTSSSDEDYVTATAENGATSGSYSIEVEQLAKNDTVLSTALASTTTASVTAGTHTFQIVTGDGGTGQYVSNIEVEFDGTETNEEMMEAIQEAINSDKAEVTSDAETADTTYSGGSAEFVINLNGTEKTIKVDGGGTYEDLIEEVVAYVNDKVTGVTAEKVTDSSGNVSVKFSVDDSSDYISIYNADDYTGYDLVSDLGIEVTQEKAASGIVTASLYAPSSGYTQLSLTAEDTGVDSRIELISDDSGSSALSSVGLNLGSSRTDYSQSSNTAGFLYSDITEDNNLLNARLSVNGVSMQNTSNSVSDVVEGLTINLKSVTETDDPVTITVGIDTETIQTEIETFITDFNNVYTYVKNNTSVDSDGAKGTLYGQINATTLMRILSGNATGEVDGLGDDALSYLSQIGITFDSTSGLTLDDSDLLEDKLENNLDEVNELFTSEDGIATVLYSKVKPYTGYGGYLQIAQESIEDKISSITDEIEEREERIEEKSEAYRAKYQNLQSQLAALYTLQNEFFGGSNSITSLFT